MSSLSNTKNELEVKNQFDKALKGLNTIRPGMSELHVAEIVKPEEVAFVNGGLVMSYPSQLFEYFITDGIVKILQRNILRAMWLFQVMHGLHFGQTTDGTGKFIGCVGINLLGYPGRGCHQSDMIVV